MADHQGKNPSNVDIKLEKLESQSQVLRKNTSQESSSGVYAPASPRLQRVDTKTNIEMQTKTKKDKKNKQKKGKNLHEQVDSTEYTMPLTGNNIGVSDNSEARVSSMNEVNMVDMIRRKASHVHTDARVDNSMLFSKMPKIQDMSFDDNTRVTTVLHTALTILSIILFIFGCIGIELSFYILGIIAIVSNAFGILHSMYSGSETSKAHRLDHALQNLAQIISKFARALDIQEKHLDSVRVLLDYFHETMPLIKHEFENKEQYNEMLHYLNLQHKSWLVSLFRQFRLLDNRFGITHEEYDEFLSKMPKRSKEIFDQLKSGIENRFRIIFSSDPESITHMVSRRRLSKLDEEMKNVGSGNKNKSQTQAPSAKRIVSIKIDESNENENENEDSDDNDTAGDGRMASRNENEEDVAITTPMVASSTGTAGENKESGDAIGSQTSMVSDEDAQNITQLAKEHEWMSKVIFYSDLEHVVNKVINDLFIDDDFVEEKINEIDAKQDSSLHLLSHRMSTVLDDDQLMHGTMEAIRSQKQLSMEKEKNKQMENGHTIADGSPNPNETTNNKENEMVDTKVDNRKSTKLALKHSAGSHGQGQASGSNIEDESSVDMADIDGLLDELDETSEEH